MSKIKKNTTHPSKIMPVIAIIIAYVTDVLYVAINRRNLINSDASAEMMLGRLLNSTGGVITDKWHYSSELRVLNTQLVYRLAMALFPDNWHYARVFSVAVFLMILSALLLVNAAKLGTAGLWWCAAVVLPVGQWYGWNVIYNSYYIPHIAISMVSVALIIAYSRSAKSQTTVQQESQTAPVLLSQTAVQQQRQKITAPEGQVTVPATGTDSNGIVSSKQIIILLLICLLGFVAGLGGTRQLMICYAPAFLAAVALCMEKLFARYGENKSLKPLELAASGENTSPKPLELAAPDENTPAKPLELAASGENKSPKPLLLAASLMLVSSTAGYLVNSNVFSTIFSYTNYSEIKINDFSLESVISCIGDLIAQIGWQGDQQLLSLRGIAGVLGVCAGFASLYMLYRIIRNRKSELSQRFLFLFIGISIIICLIVYSQTSIYNCSYWIPLLPFVILALIMGVEDWISEKKPEMGVEDWLYGKKTGGDVTENHVSATDKIQTFMFGNLQTIIFAVITTVFFICSIATMQNPYISWVPNDLTIQSVADWLVENGYTQGCATFWNSDVLTELSDGKIEMWTVNEMNELDTNQWLQETSHDTQMPDGEFFIITTPDEYTQNAETWKLPALTDYLVYGDDNYFVFAFDSVEEYMGM